MNTFIIVIALCLIAVMMYTGEKKKKTRPPQVLRNQPGRSRSARPGLSASAPRSLSSRTTGSRTR